MTTAAETLQLALDRAYQALGEIQGVYYRRDIGHRALKKTHSGWGFRQQAPTRRRVQPMDSSLMAEGCEQTKCEQTRMK